VFFFVGADKYYFLAGCYVLMVHNFAFLLIFSLDGQTYIKTDVVSEDWRFRH
jgi:hypothetical protein